MGLRTFRPTIRTRLTLAAAAITVAMLAVASLTLVAIQRRELTNGIDESLRQEADNFVFADGVTEIPPIGDPEDTFLQIVDSSGAVVASTANLSNRPVIAAVNADGIRTARVDQPSGRFRILARTIDQDGRQLVVLIGKNLDDVSDGVHVLITALAVVSPVLILLFAGLAWWLVGRTLRPVDGIQREVQTIGGSELYRRVPVPSTNDEIAGLARTMNEMLARVEAASEQQQRFVDDASHELRTPLTRMITELDVALAHPETEDAGVTVRRIHDDATDLRALLEDLLFLARNTNDGQVPNVEVDLDDVARSVAANARGSTKTRIDTSAVAAASTHGDARALHRAIANVVANAARHAASTVSISLEERNGRAHVVIDDDGGGVPPQHRQRVFERFTRLDEARSRDGGGVGLGLAIAKEIVTRHGGSITVSDSPSGGARFEIVLPTARDQAASPIAG